MPNRDNHMPSYPVLEMVINAIADWVGNYRYAIGLRDQFAACGPDEVMLIARDIGMSPNELRELASKGPGSADLLKKMLVALKFDPKTLEAADPRLTRDLQRLCTICGNKRQCEHELVAGTAAKNIREFCPNAVSLEMLFKPSESPPTRSN